MKYRQQFDSSDCGAACLAMIASYFGMSLNIAKTRLYACTDTSGTNFKGLINAAKIYNLKIRVVKGNISSITNKLYTPFIAHLNIVRDDNNWVNHYVIVKKITKKYIEIWAPDPLYKKQKLTYEKFFESWTFTQHILQVHSEARSCCKLAKIFRITVLY